MDATRSDRVVDEVRKRVKVSRNCSFALTIYASSRGNVPTFMNTADISPIQLSITSWKCALPEQMSVHSRSMCALRYGLYSGYFNSMYLGVSTPPHAHVSTSATPIFVGVKRPASFFSA